MATLVLTAVGGIVGGPVGAAIGGVLGQAVDTRVLARKGRQGPRLTDLSVQTSSYGTAVPPVFGTMRMAGTVIWATDLAEHRTSARGGKGQGAATTYSYTASFAVALSSRAILGIGRVWADGTLIRGRDGAFKVATGFRVHDGGEAQAADPLIAAAEGATLAPAHRGLAYVVFEDLALGDFGNRIPSLTFEVIADAAPVPVGVIASAVAGAVLRGTGPALAFDGFAANGDGARGVLEALATASGAWFRDEGGMLAMVTGVGAATTVADAGVAREGVGSGSGGRMRSIAPGDTVPRTLSVRHYDPARDGQIGVQQAQRPGIAGGRRAEQIEVAAALPAATARAMAAAMLVRAEVERTRRHVTLDVTGAAIPPGARVTIAGEAGGQWRVVRTTLEAMVTTLEVVPIAGAVPVLAASPGRALAQRDAAAGATILAAFETPPADDAPPTAPVVSIAAAGTGAGWRRAALSWSLDEGATWTDPGTTALPATIGTLASALGIGPTTLVDGRHAIEAVLAHEAMTLVSADAAALDAGANVALVGDELIQFAAAREVSAGRWRLTGLRRGVRATPVAAHDAGTRFVMADAAALVSLALPVGSVGATLRILASGVGDREGAATAAAVVTGASILPHAPVAARATPQGDGRVRIIWVRRSRAGWRWVDGIDVPLGEEREAYRIEIATAGAVRTVDTDAPMLVLDAADAVPGTRLAIRQVGTAGLSRPLTFTL